MREIGSTVVSTTVVPIMREAQRAVKAVRITVWLEVGAEKSENMINRATPRDMKKKLASLKTTVGSSK